MDTDDDAPATAPVDATGADPEEQDAKQELFEAIDHLKNAASILFGRAANDPAVKNAGREAERMVKKLEDAAEPMVKQLSDAAEPLAKQLTGELGRLTRDVLDVVEGGARRR